ncbi:PEP-utilizing enzyme [Bacillus sp. FSL W7-1334]|uniref:PEP-utilizing enzyme n=1 Tax=Bacillus sp. FSL W7-1334 TaxID=2921703 RepID=UPI0030FCA85F
MTFNSNNSEKQANSFENDNFDFSDDTKQSIQIKLDKFGFSFDVEKLLIFIRDTFAKRELYKFEFTKNLSLALKLISEFGEQYGFSNEELSFINIEDIIRYSNCTVPTQNLEYLRSISNINKNEFELNSLLSLPDVIFSEKDIEIINLQSRDPNFITNKKIIASSYVVENFKNNLDEEDFTNKIVMIENADPGYEWVFSKRIGGLVTKYGGAASHMAIRCAEFGIPAAIGCGENIYNSLLDSNTIMLNCMEKKVVKLK